jgi:methylmalonyl-CoA epimerase
MSILDALKDCRLDHVAVATESIFRSQKIFESLGLVFEEREEIVETQKVKTKFAAMDNHAHLELLEPTSSESAIAQFIAKKGAGIHHMAFLVSDVEKKAQELRSQGFILIYEKAQDGANNKLINFIHPKSTGGILIEISQEK